MAILITQTGSGNHLCLQDVHALLIFHPYCIMLEYAVYDLL